MRFSPLILTKVVIGVKRSKEEITEAQKVIVYTSFRALIRFLDI